MIIEDEPEFAEIVRYSVEREGCSTRVAMTDQEGLECAA